MKDKREICELKNYIWKALVMWQWQRPDFVDAESVCDCKMIERVNVYCLKKIFK